MFQLVAELSRDCSTRPFDAGSTVGQVWFSYSDQSFSQLPRLSEQGELLQLGAGVAEAPDDLPTLYKCVESYMDMSGKPTFYERLYTTIPDGTGLIPYAISFMMGPTKISFTQTANLAMLHSRYGWLKSGLTTKKAVGVYTNPLLNFVSNCTMAEEALTIDQLRASSTLYATIEKHPLKELLAPLWFSSDEATLEMKQLVRYLNSSHMWQHPEVTAGTASLLLPMGIPVDVTTSLLHVGADDLMRRMRQIGYPIIDVATPLPMRIDRDRTWVVDSVDLTNNTFLKHIHNVVGTEMQITGVFTPITGRFTVDTTNGYYTNRYAFDDEIRNWGYQTDMRHIRDALCGLSLQLTNYTTVPTFPGKLIPTIDAQLYAQHAGSTIFARITKSYLEEWLIELIDPNTAEPIVSVYADMAWLTLFGAAVSFG